MAPGWLDREEKILQPKRTSVTEAPKSPTVSVQPQNLMDEQDHQRQPNEKNIPGLDTAGDELDRAFGGMGLRNR